jgi:hypothetical protein
MLTREAIEKALALYEGGATESTVAQATGISLSEAEALADALNNGEA